MQSGFHNIDVNLSPHNLHGYNPNILVRYQPEYNNWFENTFMQSYVPPYTTGKFTGSNPAKGHRAVCTRQAAPMLYV